MHLSESTSQIVAGFTNTFVLFALLWAQELNGHVSAFCSLGMELYPFHLPHTELFFTFISRMIRLRSTLTVLLLIPK
jgi:hypothetical protein